MANTARVTQSFLIAGTFLSGNARVTQSFIIAAVGLGIACGSPINGTVGIPYSHTFPSGGGIGAVTFVILTGSLPPGITLNSSTGVLSGTPTSPGAFPITVQVTDTMHQVASVACLISIAASGVPTYGAAHRKCVPGEMMKPSRVDKVDVVGIQRILDAVKPDVVAEVDYPGRVRG